MRYLEETAIKVAQDITNKTLKINQDSKTLSDKFMNYVLHFDFVKDQVFNLAKEKVKQKTGSLYPAPFKILDVMRISLNKESKLGYEAEAKAFGELGVTPQCKGLTNLFFGQTTCKKNRFGVPKNAVKYAYFYIYYIKINNFSCKILIIHIFQKNCCCWCWPYRSRYCSSKHR